VSFLKRKLVEHEALQREIESLRDEVMKIAGEARKQEG